MRSNSWIAICIVVATALYFLIGGILSHRTTKNNDLIDSATGKFNLGCGVLFFWPLLLILWLEQKFEFLVTFLVGWLLRRILWRR